MTRVTIARRPRKDVVDMAGGAWKRRMRSGKRVAGVLQVIEFRIEPRVHGVAGFTCGGEARGSVINYRRPEILLMARVAGGRKPGELPRGCGLMALVTSHQSVSTDQRETVVVPFDCVD